MPKFTRRVQRRWISIIPQLHSPSGNSEHLCRPLDGGNFLCGRLQSERICARGQSSMLTSCFLGRGGLPRSDYAAAAANIAPFVDPARAPVRP